MSPTIHLRNARKEELPALAQLSVRAFRGRPMSEALFPQHLQTGPSDEDDARTALHLLKFDREDLHYIVAADEVDNALGYAVWQSSPRPAVEARSKGLEDTVAKLRADRPKGLDVAVLEEIEKAMVVLDKVVRDALGDDGYTDAWYLDSLAVDPAQQRRGIGKMLVQWGQDRADEEHKNVRFTSSEKGAKLYRSLGYEEIGSLEICKGTEYAFIKKAA